MVGAEPPPIPPPGAGAAVRVFSDQKIMNKIQSRPKYLDLTQIRLPLPGLVSILHRISGALLFLALPFLLWLLEASLESQETYAAFHAVANRPLTKLVFLVLAWAYFHHIAAGIRHLALDVHIGVDLPQARATSVAVFAVSLLLTVVAGVLIW